MIVDFDLGATMAGCTKPVAWHCQNLSPLQSWISTVTPPPISRWLLGAIEPPDYLTYPDRISAVGISSILWIGAGGSFLHRTSSCPPLSRFCSRVNPTVTLTDSTLRVYTTLSGCFSCILLIFCVFSASSFVHVWGARLFSVP